MVRARVRVRVPGLPSLLHDTKPNSVHLHRRAFGQGGTAHVVAAVCRALLIHLVNGFVDFIVG